MNGTFDREIYIAKCPRQEHHRTEIQTAGRILAEKLYIGTWFCSLIVSMSDWWDNDAYRTSKSAGDTSYAAKDYERSIDAYGKAILELRAKQSDPRAAGSGLGTATQKVTSTHAITTTILTTNE